MRCLLGSRARYAACRTHRILLRLILGSYQGLSQQKHVGNIRSLSETKANYQKAPVVHTVFAFLTSRVRAYVRAGNWTAPHSSRVVRASVAEGGW